MSIEDDHLYIMSKQKNNAFDFRVWTMKKVGNE